VSGLVLVDPASEFLKISLTPEQWATYIKATKKLIESKGLEAPDHARTLDLLRRSPRIPTIPVVVLTSDKRFDFGAGGPETWRRGEPLMIVSQSFSTRKHVSDTNSGHAIQMEQPGLVIESIKGVVEAARKSARGGDFAGLVDIGDGHKMYLKCGGTGSPSVVLVGGLRASADDWSISDKSKPTVFTEVEKFTRVCACDRPGTPVGEKPSRSDPSAADDSEGCSCRFARSAEHRW